MVKKRLVIFPFNGNGIEALDCLDTDEYEFVGFIDDDLNKKSPFHKIFSRSILFECNDLKVLAIPGSPTSYKAREEIISSLDILPSRYISLIHPNASIGREVKIGSNCLIMAGVVLTSNARIEDHVCILPNSVVHHDSVIGKYSLIGSNVVVAGGVNIGTSCYIGSGSNIINGVSIGNYSLVGLGSNVVCSINSYTKVAGNPARDLTVYKNP